jgi:hypothetical protein
MKDFSQPHEFRQDHRIDKGKAKPRRVVDVVVRKDDFTMECKNAQQDPDVHDSYGELPQFVERALFPARFFFMHHGESPLFRQKVIRPATARS